MRRGDAFKTVGGGEYLRAKLPGRRIDGPPDIGQHGVMKAVFNLIHQNNAIRRGGYRQNEPGYLGHPFAHDGQRHQLGQSDVSPDHRYAA